MPTRDFYTLPEAAQILEVSQRRLLDRLESGEIEGEQDPQSARWKIPKHAVDERVSADPSPEETAEEAPGESAEMIQGLVDELGDVHRQVGHLRNRLDRARRTEKEERELLLAELEQERERYRRERVRADRLHEEANKLREELETNKGSWRRLFGG
ncbi:MAG: helix-turn-helix domain-containing protein [Actinomycetota bacterium]|nr:helix-turn-helix domain-containing protein [Actinomycetota bacterium]